VTAVPPILSVRDLTVEFRTRRGIVHALEGVRLDVRRHQMVGVVGESGSGKSVTAFAIMRLLDRAARVRSGSILFEGLDLLQANAAELDTVRGRDLSIVFQNPRTALNPIRPVGTQIADVIGRHQPAPSSGIAMALVCRPRLLIADEPTTGLDVTTQAAVMDLIREAVDAGQTSAILITHDLALASEYCDHIVVMHAGHVVESAPSATLFAAPRHPYTAKLLRSIPSAAPTIDALQPIPGSLPDLRRGDLPPCRFSARCDRYAAVCDAPPLRASRLDADHDVACRIPL